MDRVSHYEEEFERFKLAFPEWDKHDKDVQAKLTAWYDRNKDPFVEGATQPAIAFAEYVLVRIHEDDKQPEMDSNVILADMRVGRVIGDHCYHLTNMTEDDLRSLLTMIKGAGLLERRTFDGVKRQIEKLLNI